VPQMAPVKPYTTALRFVLFIGVVSFFADFTYEGSRSITGPLLEVLGASAAVVAIIAGVGELLGYGLRLLSGPLSEKTRQFWPITLFGYFIQMLSVPALAFVRTWRVAAALILVERIGKAIRNPPRDVMLSHAAKEMGYGWGFGVHEALDQAGALFGPLLVAAMLSHRGEYRLAYETLLIPALLTLSFLLIARFTYPNPQDFEPPPVAQTSSKHFPRAFWVYLIGAALVAAGFADFSLVAFHFKKTAVVPSLWIPIFYSVAMAVSGLGSLLFGRFLDRVGIRILIPLTLITAISAPLLFLGHFAAALIGAALWGLGMGVHESVIPAAVANIVPAARRPTAYGLFTGSYGVSWFLGSVVIGFLYESSPQFVAIFCVIVQIAAIPFFLQVKKLLNPILPVNQETETNRT
jgi:MFS family permease